MEIQTPFITPVATFDVSKHLPLLRHLFKKSKEENLFGVVKPGFKSTLTGYSADKSKNCFPQGNETMELQQDMVNAATKLATFMGYTGDKYAPSITRFWLNEMGSDTAHPPHSHCGYHFSGCIYVDVPDNSGNIVFSSYRERYDYLHMEVEQYTVFNANTWGFTPKEGQLFLWESWIRHSVPATPFEGVRRSVAFDVLMLS
jgi:uncharacterized protein (TIGR02466 family)